MKFRLEYSDDIGFHTAEFEAGQISEVLTRFEHFLKGAGFVIGSNEHIVLWDEDIEQLTAIADGEWKALDE